MNDLPISLCFVFSGDKQVANMETLYGRLSCFLFSFVSEHHRHLILIGHQVLNGKVQSGHHSPIDFGEKNTTEQTRTTHVIYKYNHWQKIMEPPLLESVHSVV